RPIHVVNLQNLGSGEIKVVNEFLDNLLFPTAAEKKAISHNVYIRDHLLFNSQYEDGLLVYDISDPVNPVLKAHFDTHPENQQYLGYYGNWGNYPWFPSGTVIAGDMQNGLYILKLDKSVSAAEPAAALPVRLSPNPATDLLRVQVDNSAGTWQWRLLSPAGQTVAQGQSAAPAAEISVQGLPQGLYFLHIGDEQGLSATQRVVVARR
ncbi:MAG TPA: T9SS type A sorting domain-containing protein, partial [Saprospiraceae bacterium]|nr:T9SS type A sorting domain-containing protein [Saprospiraceae bacterium]